MRGSRVVVALSLGLLIPVAAHGQVPSPPYGPPTVTPMPPGAPPSFAHTCSTRPDNVVANCGFESGDFTSWVAVDLTTPLFPLSVAGPTSIGYGFFTSAPTEGVVSALTGFDGDGPGTIQLGQDVVLPGTAVLDFDYRAAWDLATFGATLDRTFEVRIEPSGGGAALQTFPLLTATTGTINTDTGPLSATLDLSGLSGMAVRINFAWTVPENFSGPAFFQLDNVQVVDATAVPAMPPAGVVGLLLLLAATAAWLLTRRQTRGPTPA